MRVVLTHPFCWPYVRRGTERNLEQLGRYLTARGHEVTTISTRPEEGPPWPRCSSTCALSLNQTSGRARAGNRLTEDQGFHPGVGTTAMERAGIASRWG